MGSIGDMFGSIGGAIASRKMGREYGRREEDALLEAERRKKQAADAKAGLKDYGRLTEYRKQRQHLKQERCKAN